MNYERSLLVRLLEIHDLQCKNLTNDYESVRRLRRQGNATYEEVREYLARPQVTDTQIEAPPKRKYTRRATG